VLPGPLASLEARIGEIPAGRDVLVHCKAGGRSAIATSILASHGVRAVNVKGGFDAWKAARLPVEQTHSAEKADAGRAN
jgi:hydroxyacylglutathione hydrolase